MCLHETPTAERAALPFLGISINDLTGEITPKNEVCRGTALHTALRRGPFLKTGAPGKQGSQGLYFRQAETFSSDKYVWEILDINANTL